MYLVVGTLCSAEACLRRAVSLHLLVLMLFPTGWLLARLLVYLPVGCFCLARGCFCDWYQLRQMGYVTNGLGGASSWYAPSGRNRYAGQRTIYGVWSTTDVALMGLWLLVGGRYVVDTIKYLSFCLIGLADVTAISNHPPTSAWLLTFCVASQPLPGITRLSNMRTPGGMGFSLESESFGRWLRM